MEDLIDSAGGWNISGVFDPKTWDLQESLQIYHNQYNRGGLFSWAVGADERNSTRNIIQLDQGGLGLPSRDYYLNKTDKNVCIAATERNDRTIKPQGSCLLISYLLISLGL